MTISKNLDKGTFFVNKIPILIIVVIVGVMLTHQEKKEESANLVANPSFSSGGSGWKESPHVDIGTRFASIDYSIYRTSPSIRLNTPSNCSAIGNDRSIWQENRIDVSSYRGQQITLSAWVRHGDCSSAPNAPCWVNPTYAGNTQVTNWDCCNLLGVCTNTAHFQGPWCSINDRGGGRLGMDFYQGGSMFKEWSVTDDWTTADNQWHYLEFTTTIPLNYVDPTFGNTYNADTAIVWMQGFECGAPASVWIDDISLIVGNGVTYSNFISYKESYLSSGDFTAFISNANSWINS